MKVDIPRSAFSKEGEQYRDVMGLGREDIVALCNNPGIFPNSKITTTNFF
jgi:hypothetical protein